MTSSKFLKVAYWAFYLDGGKEISFIICCTRFRYKYFDLKSLQQNLERNYEMFAVYDELTQHGITHSITFTDFKFEECARRSTCKLPYCWYELQILEKSDGDLLLL